MNFRRNDIGTCWNKKFIGHSEPIKIELLRTTGTLNFQMAAIIRKGKLYLKNYG